MPRRRPGDGLGRRRGHDRPAHDLGHQHCSALRRQPVLVLTIFLLTSCERRAKLLTMSGKAIADREEAPRRDRRAERRDATRTEILEAAWDLAREQGLTELSCATSAIGSGCGRSRSTRTSTRSTRSTTPCSRKATRSSSAGCRWSATPRRTSNERFRLGAHSFVEFALEDLPRCQLLFLRTVPGFEPSPEAYAPAVLVLEITADRTRRHRHHPSGDARHLDRDCSAGIMQQQWANDPGGDRWRKLLDDVIAMYLAYAKKRRS